MVHSVIVLLIQLWCLWEQEKTILTVRLITLQYPVIVTQPLTCSVVSAAQIWHGKQFPLLQQRTCAPARNPGPPLGHIHVHHQKSKQELSWHRVWLHLYNIHFPSFPELGVVGCYYGNSLMCVFQCSIEIWKLTVALMVFTVHLLHSSGLNGWQCWNAGTSAATTGGGGGGGQGAGTRWCGVILMESCALMLHSELHGVYLQTI